MREMFEYHIFFHFLKPCLQDLWQDILENKSWWITVWTCCWYMRHINAGLKRLSVCIHTCGIILNIFGNKSIKGHIQHFKMANVLWLEVHFILWMKYELKFSFQTLQCCHNEDDGISSRQPHDCLLNRLLKRRSKKTSKLHVTYLCEGNSLVTGEFPAQRASNAENVAIRWCCHGLSVCIHTCTIISNIFGNQSIKGHIQLF